MKTRYGSDGNAAIIEDGISEREIHYSYDFLGQIERQEEKGDGYQHSISWKYDSYGRKTGMLEKLKLRRKNLEIQLGPWPGAYRHEQNRNKHQCCPAN